MFSCFFDISTSKKHNFKSFFFSDNGTNLIDLHSDAPIATELEYVNVIPVSSHSNQTTQSNDVFDLSKFKLNYFKY